MSASLSPDQCPSCGRELAANGTCVHCARNRIFRLFQRELLLLLLLAVVDAAAYVATRAYAGTNARTKVEMASAWFHQGQQALAGNDANAAVAAFRKASVNDHGRQLYSESLAQALVLAGRGDEARQLLLQLRESAPENPQVNLELARLAAGKRDVPEALRYYHNALYGIWSGDHVNERQRDVRAELIHFLVAEQARERAQSEILALAYHLPDDIPAHLELGDMFARVGDSQRSYSEFELVLRREPHNEMGLAGAGSAAFQLRRYAEAAQLLGQLPPGDPASHEILNLATLAANNDPLDPRLSYRERLQRVISGFDQAGNTLNGCMAKNAAGNSSDLMSLSQKFSGMKSSLTSEKLRRSPDLVFTAMELIYQGETETSKVCGPLPPLDHALLLVAQKDRGER